MLYARLFLLCCLPFVVSTLTVVKSHEDLENVASTEDKQLRHHHPNHFENIDFLHENVDFSLEEPQQISADKASKINWLPVWEEIEIIGANDIRQADSLHTEPRSKLKTAVEYTPDVTVEKVVHVHHVPVEIPVHANILVQQPKQAKVADENCDAPNGQGLKNLLKQAKTLIPFERIRALVANATANDNEVRAVKNLLSTNKFRALAASLQQTNEVSALRDYFCKVLHMDLRYYLNFVRSLVDFSAVNQLNSNSTSDTFRGRRGIRGLILDIYDLLPQQQLIDLYENLFNNDEYLVFAVRRLNSKEFRQLVKNFKTTRQLHDMITLLENVGVPIMDVRDLVNAALGWQGNEPGRPNYKLKI
ncbi:uncharacterized protein LOC119663673 [Teleopsis dalmanni]|uniref:uncharacterized protein LOC119661940 n=1 Tax=Teleopsis dalmanni TaxID=139649 RepID=UPI0018CE10E1|nr:uncharacterized protein LOC119661940 [Teleopsis dalmanni]XP_037927465.1 uncharacterized protein LOC119662000 [Teleopsis dalmanni]XP_037929208.1 uncharacterized protein LOC119663673 [Teleopsis dalmanni]